MCQECDRWPYAEGRLHPVEALSRLDMLMNAEKWTQPMDISLQWCSEARHEQ